MECKRCDVVEWLLCLRRVVVRRVKVISEREVVRGFVELGFVYIQVNTIMRSKVMHQ